MSKYMIHTCLERQWYVEQYLIPSMLEQGINREDIIPFIDNGRRGNLTAFLDSLDFLVKNYPMHMGVWHLQDDVVISSDFKKVTEENDVGIVQGFCSILDDREDYWFSFQCFRLPMYNTSKFLSWLKENWKKYQNIISTNKCDDTLFRLYLIENQLVTTKLYPNIVEHIDYLIGGSVVNKKRNNKIIKSKYWTEESLLTELAIKLSRNTH